MFVYTFILFLFSLLCSVKYKGISSAVISVSIIFLYSFFFKILPSPPPIDVPLVILSVTLATSALEVAGGLSFFVKVSEKMINKYPAQITFMGPLIVYFLVFFSGSGHTLYSVLPVIARVSKKVGINPEKPLSGAVIAAQQGLIASPISSPTIIVLGSLSVLGFSLKNLVLLYFPATLIATLVMCLFLSQKKDLAVCEIDNSEKMMLNVNRKIKISIGIFSLGILFIMIAGWVEKIRILKSDAMEVKSISMMTTLTLSMFFISALIIILCNIKSKDIIESESFKSGIQAAISILGISWLGNIFISTNKLEVLTFMKYITSYNEWFFGLILFLFCIPLMSQSATLKLILPLGVSLGINKFILLSVVPMVNSLFLLPTYPTMLAANQLDTTGNTTLGKNFFDHSFIVPGLISTISSTAISITFIKIFCIK